MATADMLFAAADSGDLTLVRSIIAENSYLINDRDEEGCTPLEVAVKKDRLEVAKYLLDQGAEVNARNKHGYSALHFVKSKAMAEVLVSKGAEVNMTENYGLTPLHDAVLEGYTDIVEFLISKGADVNVIENKGFTPLKMAVKYHLPEIEAILRRHNAVE
jgi:ankyrin repeat protein